MRAIRKFIWRFMVIFSFIVNFVLVLVLLGLGLLIFDIKSNIATPLVAGLHSSFVGLDQATIDWTIPVRDTIPVVLNIPLDTDTTVVLTAPVPLNVNATIDLPNFPAFNVPATVALTLPAGLELPVSLDLNVPVDEELDISLDVRAVIPLQETQIHDPVNNLRLLFEPLTRALFNLPDDFGEAGALASDVLAGNPPNLLEDNAYSLSPWPGYSRTAGLNYDLLGQPMPLENVPRLTGIVQTGGIPLLDEQLRPEVYASGGPEAVNAQAATALQAQGIDSRLFDGQMGNYVQALQAQAQQASPDSTSPGGETDTGEPSDEDLGIITPESSASPGGG
jgi:hypothetical protein